MGRFFRSYVDIISLLELCHFGINFIRQCRYPIIWQLIAVDFLVFNFFLNFTYFGELFVIRRKLYLDWTCWAGAFIQIHLYLYFGHFDETVFSFYTRSCHEAKVTINSKMAIILRAHNCIAKFAWRLNNFFARYKIPFPISIGTFSSSPKICSTKFDRII